MTPTVSGRRRSSWWRLADVPALLVALAVGAVTYGCTRTPLAPAPPPGFYTWPAPLRSSPGTLLRYRSLGVPIAGARAFRILYVSTTSGGLPRTTGGVLVVPDATPPAAGRPVVAWAHPVVGTDTAPSASTTPLASMEPWLSRGVHDGWVVVATDFVAVGTHRQETFVGRAETDDLAYSVVAARQLPQAHAGTAWVVFGASSGGHGALWSGSIAPALVPGLRLLGIAAVAPVAELVPIEHAEGKPWAPRLSAQTPSPPPAAMPVFIAQGTRDDIVPAATTELLQHQWCTAGSTLFVDWLGGVTHEGAVGAASPSAVNWIQHRFLGSPAPRNCGVGPPVGRSSG